MLELADLLAREAIRDLVARYNAYGDGGLIDRMVALFAEDAVLDIGDAAYEGRAAIRGLFSGTVDRSAAAAGGPAYVRHGTTTHQIDLVDDTHATGRCYFTVLTRIGLDHWGRYLDDYRVVDGEWRFARRRVVTDDFAPGSLFAPSGT
ncbi:MAG: nuclear transport factor 2 family protein [Acidimicrobiales bacterium]|nr:nuclear transport factor 2 family protein [Acidimicrobiales bacterium]